MSDSAKGPSAVKADKNPKGGLSAKGRAKFGVQAGVKNYASASRKDKGRWVSWALRFTKSPKPLVDDKGNPTRYALMFRAWGEPVPKTREAVAAVHAKAMTRSAQLKKADKADLARVDNELVECADCSVADVNGRVFIELALLLEHIDVTHLDGRPNTNTKEDAAMAIENYTCSSPDCDRSFLTGELATEHAEAVHTFSDIEELVRDAVRDKYNRDGDRQAVPPIPYRYAWVRDISADWVVFEMNVGEKGTTFKSSYSITDGSVTLGEPVEVVRKTVYEPVKQEAASASRVTKVGAYFYEEVSS